MSEDLSNFNAEQAKAIVDKVNLSTSYEVALKSTLESIKFRASEGHHDGFLRIPNTHENNEVAHKVITELKSRGFLATENSPFISGDDIMATFKF